MPAAGDRRTARRRAGPPGSPRSSPSASSSSSSRRDDAARARARGRRPVLPRRRSATRPSSIRSRRCPASTSRRTPSCRPIARCIVERVATLYRLTQPALRPRIVVTSAEALRAAHRRRPPSSRRAGATIEQGDTIDRDAARRAARRRRLGAHAGRRRAGHVRGARRRDRRLRAARAAPGAHRAVRRRGRVAALVRCRVAAHAARRSIASTSIRCARRSRPARATCARGCATYADEIAFPTQGDAPR